MYQVETVSIFIFFTSSLAITYEAKEDSFYLTPIY